MGRPIVFTLLILLGVCGKMQAQKAFLKNGEAALPIAKNKMVLPQNFYNQHLSFFCKKEMALQKLTNTNLFIRLGSKQYVDYLEQKPNARKEF